MSDDGCRLDVSCAEEFWAGKGGNCSNNISAVIRICVSGSKCAVFESDPFVLSALSAPGGGDEQWSDSDPDPNAAEGDKGGSSQQTIASCSSTDDGVNWSSATVLSSSSKVSSIRVEPSRLCWAIMQASCIPTWADDMDPED